MGILQLYELHEEVRLCQAEQSVYQSKVRLIKFHAFLHRQTWLSAPYTAEPLSAVTLLSCSASLSQAASLHLTLIAHSIMDMIVQQSQESVS